MVYTILRMLSPGSLVFATRARSGILASRWGIGVDRQIDRARTSTYQFHWHSQDGRGDSTGPNDCADLLVACGQSADGRGGAAKGGGSRRRSVWGIEARGERREARRLYADSPFRAPADPGRDPDCKAGIHDGAIRLFSEVCEDADAISDS